MSKILAFLIFVSSGLALGAGKDYVPGFTLLPAKSLGSNVTSVPVDTRGWDNIDIELVVTGTPTGSFFVDCTLNPTVPPSTVTQTWVTIPLVPAPVVLGAASNIMIELNQMGCMFIQIRYVRTSSTGTLTAYVSEKQI